MAKTIDKTGVYRNKQSGHAVYLTKGATPGEGVLENYEYDGAASGEYFAQPETNYFSTTQDAPQDQKAEDTWSGRMVSGAPQNRKEGPVENRSDAELANDASKGKK